MSDQSNTHAIEADHSGHHEHVAHIMPLPYLIGTFLALLFFTWLTVFIADQDIGEIDIFIALSIATVKSAFVATFFMHLRYDKAFNVLMLLFCLGFVALFIGIALLDSSQYQPSIEAFYNATATVEP